MAAIKSFLKLILYKPLFNLLILLVWLTPGHNVGVGIIALTVIIRLLLLPSSAKSIEAQNKLKNLQPEIDKIKEKYKTDQQAQAKATMDFYKANKISPFSSCLPLLIQFPILIILYYVFQSGLNTNRFAELLYSFTPRPEFISTMFLGIDLSKPNIYLAIITGLLQFWQTKQMSPVTPPSADKGQNKNDMFQNVLTKQMLYIMPIFTVFIALKLPAALPLYWSITTLFMVAQQWYLMKKGNDSKSGVSVAIRNKK